MKNEQNSQEPQNPALRVGAVSGSASVKKFRRGKNFQQAYFEIGNTNQMITNLLIEAETFERYGNIDEANDRKKTAHQLKEDLKNKYDETFDLDYYIPQCSGQYVKQSRRDVL